MPADGKAAVGQNFRFDVFNFVHQERLPGIAFRIPRGGNRPGDGAHDVVELLGQSAFDVADVHQSIAPRVAQLPYPERRQLTPRRLFGWRRRLASALWLVTCWCSGHSPEMTLRRDPSMSSRTMVGSRMQQPGFERVHDRLGFYRPCIAN